MYNSLLQKPHTQTCACVCVCVCVHACVQSKHSCHDYSHFVSGKYNQRPASPLLSAVFSMVADAFSSGRADLAGRKRSVNTRSRSHWVLRRLKYELPNLSPLRLPQKHASQMDRRFAVAGTRDWAGKQTSAQCSSTVERGPLLVLCPQQ